MGDLALRKSEAYRGKWDAFEMDPRLLVVDPKYNIRDTTTAEYRTELDQLKALILANEGVSEPLMVRMRGTECLVVRGHRRRQATMELIAEGHNIETVPCIQEPKGTTELDREFDLKASNSGSNLKASEFANLIYRVLNLYRVPEKEAARRFGVSLEVLRYSLEFRTIAEPVQEMVRKGEVSATLARKVTEKHGADAPAVLAEAKKNAKPAKDGTVKVRPRNVKAAEPKEEPKLGPINVIRTGEPFERPGPEDIDPEAVTTGFKALRELTKASDAAFARARLSSGPTAALHPTPEGAKAVDWSQFPTGTQGETRDDNSAIEGLIETLRPFARFAFDYDLTAFEDDHTLGVKVADLKRAAVTFAKITGGMEP